MTDAENSKDKRDAPGGRWRLFGVAFAGLPEPVQATILMVLAMACFASMAVFIRLAAEGVPALEIVFFRNFFALLILLPLLWRSGMTMLRTEKLGLYGLRAALNAEAALQRERFPHAEHQEAAAAFREKRKPDFNGRGG